MTDYEAIEFDIRRAARLLNRQGLSVAVGPDEMLVNHFGPSFATLTPENVVRVDFAGKVLDGDAYVNDTMRLHGIIHRENPRAAARAARDLGREPVAVAPAAAPRTGGEMARIPVLPPPWKDPLARLRSTNPDLFGGREN